MRAAPAGAIAAVALVCSSASAQLPELPEVDLASQSGRVRQAPVTRALLDAVDQVPRPDLPGPVEDVAGDVANEPLPEPLESVVEDSPAGPVREELRRVVSGSGGGPAGKDAAGGDVRAAAATSGGAAQPGSSSRQPAGSAGSQSSAGASRDSGSAPAAGEGSGAGGAGPDGTVAAGIPPEVAAQAPGGQPGAQSTDSGSLSRTIRQIVRVVPDEVWIALAALALLALALAARALVDRRRARALEREREQLLADVGLLERALLPAVPERLGALSASVAYRPAAGPGAGGDFYDAFELPGGEAAVVVGDVSGHGREALERTSSMRATLHACLEAGMSPRATLEAATRGPAGDPGGGFTTVVVAVHDPASGMLTYATAGHPPPILVGPAAHEPITVAGSPPIGIGIRTGLRQTTVALTPGSAACFFTDGLLEARTASDELLGRERLTEIVEGLAPGERADELLERVIAMADGTPDDMAACLIRAVDGPEMAAPRTEELELEAEELELGVGERFLAACGAPKHTMSSALEQARSTIVEASAAVLLVEVDDFVRHVTVEAPVGRDGAASGLVPS